jgi:NOP5NT (NUC127) domain
MSSSYRAYQFLRNFFFFFGSVRLSLLQISMLVLYETAAGFALFKLVDDGKMEKPENIWKDFQTAEQANKTYVDRPDLNNLFFSNRVNLF